MQLVVFVKKVLFYKNPHELPDFMIFNMNLSTGFWKGIQSKGISDYSSNLLSVLHLDYKCKKYEYLDTAIIFITVI